MASGNMATIHFHGQHLHSANELTIYVDNVKKRSYYGGRSCVVEVTPGEHTIQILVYNDASEEAYYLDPLSAYFEAGGEYDIAPGTSDQAVIKAARAAETRTETGTRTGTGTGAETGPRAGTGARTETGTRAGTGARTEAGTGAGKRGGCGCLLWIIIAVVLIAGVLLCASSFLRSPSTVTDQTPPTEQAGTPSDEMPDDSGDEQSGCIFPNSGTELISQDEIEGLSDNDLTYAINEIYARHGYIFRSEELRAYYEQFSWYTGEIPSNEFSTDCFNQIEQQNWSLLVGERNKRKASG